MFMINPCLPTHVGLCLPAKQVEDHINAFFPLPIRQIPRLRGGNEGEEGLDVSWRIGVEAGGSFTDSKERVELTEAGAEDWREFSRVACGFDLVVIDHYELAAEADKRADFPWMRFDAGVGREPTTAALIHNALPGMHQDDYAARLLNPKARVLKGPMRSMLGMVMTRRKRGRVNTRWPYSNTSRQRWPGQNIQLIQMEPLRRSKYR
jgi:hypothetical protein